MILGTLVSSSESFFNLGIQVLRLFGSPTLNSSAVSIGICSNSNIE